MLFLCELYKDRDSNYMDNTDVFNNSQRTWVPCGKTYNIIDDENE